MTTYSGKDFWREHPTKWPTVPLRKVAKLGTGHTPSRSVPEYWENCTIPWLTTEDLTSRRGVGPLEPVMQTRQLISELGLAHSAAEVHPADTVMLSRTASVGHVARVGKPMATTQAFVTWTCSEARAPRYLTAVLLAMNPEFFRLAYGSTHLTIYMPDIEQLRVPLPPLAEQRAIADYLGSETARIDALIAKKQQLIHLIEERRNGMLDSIALPTLQFGHLEAPSDVPGDCVPPGWSAPPIGSLLRRITYGFTNPMPTVDYGPYMLTANDIGSDGSVNFESARRTSDDAFSALTSKSRPQAGDVLVTKDGSLGRIALFEGGRACVNQSVAVLTADSVQVEPELLALLLRVPAYNDALISQAGGTTIKHLYITRIVKQRLALPPIAERRAFIDRLQTVFAGTAIATDRIQRQIDLLFEYRQALITGAVTGEVAATKVA